jgi:hypothetical protein
MAYLRWLTSTWCAYWLAGTGPGDDAILRVHSHASFDLSAKTLRDEGCRRSVHHLRRLVEPLFAGVPAERRPDDADWVELSTAVDDFPREVYEGGLIPVPPQTARRIHLLRRLVVRGLERLEASRRSDPTATSPARLAALRRIFDWQEELTRLSRQYPPPHLPRAIRQLRDARARRLLAGEVVSPEQDADERAAIDAAQEWIRQWPVAAW